ncbi:unnamed protein product [Nippostrongylus brasiliensis]|uniref:Uncharacterized protein n=1 Tax=Nippostrongylus brasiliensis TaxID=27835 RepID=A0A0N4YP06_NIPBR|nr:unnamed protein product [Nippostrongylus brasiliensis]
MWTLLSILGHLKRGVIANEVTRPEGNDDSIAVEVSEFNPTLFVAFVMKPLQAVDFFNGADNEAEETEESRCVPNSPASVSGIGMDFSPHIEIKSTVNLSENESPVIKMKSQTEDDQSCPLSQKLEWNDEFEQNAEVLQHKTVEQLRTPGDVSPPGNVSANDSLQISAAFRSFLLLTSTPATNSTCASPLQQQLSMYEVRNRSLLR